MRGVLKRIMGRIEAERALAREKRRSAPLGFLLLFSTASFLIAAFALGGFLDKPEFASLLAAIFQAPLFFIEDWKDSAAFLLQSLNIFYFIFFLIALLTLLQSLKRILKHRTDIISLHQTIKSNFR